MVLYMCSSLLKLAPGSSDLSDVEKKAIEIAKIRKNGPGPVKKKINISTLIGMSYESKKNDYF